MNSVRTLYLDSATIRSMTTLFNRVQDRIYQLEVQAGAAAMAHLLQREENLRDQALALNARIAGLGVALREVEGRFQRSTCTFAQFVKEVRESLGFSIRFSSVQTGRYSGLLESGREYLEIKIAHEELLSMFNEVFASVDADAHPSRVSNP